MWIEDAALACWQTSGPNGQARYKDAAVQTSLMLRMAFKLALRQTEGDCRKIGGAPASWLFSRLFSDQGWMRGLDVEVGKDRG